MMLLVAQSRSFDSSALLSTPQDQKHTFLKPFKPYHQPPQTPHKPPKPQHYPLNPSHYPLNPSQHHPLTPPKPNPPSSPKGIIKTGDEIEIVGVKDAVTKSTVTGVEMFKKLLNQGQAGDNVGLLLRGLKREDVVRGQLIAKPGSVKTHKRFEAEVYALTKEEGGRHTPFTNNYRPQFFFRTADITGGWRFFFVLGWGGDGVGGDGVGGDGVGVWKGLPPCEVHATRTQPPFH